MHFYCPSSSLSKDEELVEVTDTLSREDIKKLIMKVQFLILSQSSTKMSMS